MEMKKIDSNGFWRIDNNPISKVGIYPYLGKQISPELIPDKIYMVYRPAEELFSDEAIESFNENPVPLINDHTMIGAQFTAPEKKGIDGVINNFRRNGDVLVGDISIFSEDMKSCIEGGKKELSMGYFCNYDLTPGTYNGQHYDAIQRDIRSNHVALVDHGRMGSDVRVYDAFCFDAMDAEFEENKHPRSKDGKFSAKGQGEQSTGRNKPTDITESILNKTGNVYKVTSPTDFLSDEDYEKFTDAQRHNTAHRASTLTDEQSNALKSYTGAAYEEINNSLRGRKVTKSTMKWSDENRQDAIKHIQSAMQPCESDLLLQRGSDGKDIKKFIKADQLEKIVRGDFSDAQEIQAALEGKTYQSKGFVSTSDFINQSTDRSPYAKENVQWIFKVPKGTRCVDLKGISKHEDEQEVLLENNSKFKIEKVHFGKIGFDNHIFITASVIQDSKKGSTMDKFTDDFDLEEVKAQDAEFEESKHPRAENGQFTSGGGGKVRAKNKTKKESWSEAVKKRDARRSEGKRGKFKLPLSETGETLLKDLDDSPPKQDENYWNKKQEYKDKYGLSTVEAARLIELEKQTAQMEKALKIMDDHWDKHGRNDDLQMDYWEIQDKLRPLKKEMGFIREDMKNTAEDGGDNAAAVNANNSEKEMDNMSDQEKIDEEITKDSDIASEIAEVARKGGCSEEAISTIVDLMKTLTETPAKDDDEAVEEEKADDEDLSLPDEEDKPVKDAECDKDKEKDINQSLDALPQKIFKMFAERDRLAKKLKPLIGDFDYSDMTMKDLSKYACDKLDLDVTGLDVQSVLSGYLAGHKENQKVYSLDNAVNNKADDEIAKYLKGE